MNRILTSYCSFRDEIPINSNAIQEEIGAIVNSKSKNETYIRRSVDLLNNAFNEALRNKEMLFATKNNYKNSGYVMRHKIENDLKNIFLVFFLSFASPSKGAVISYMYLLCFKIILFYAVLFGAL